MKVPVLVPDLADLEDFANRHQHIRRKTLGHVQFARQECCLVLDICRRQPLWNILRNGTNPLESTS